MARTFTLLEIETRLRDRADIKYATRRFPSTELREMISSSYAELYALLARSKMNYFESTVNITATGATSYALPGDYLQTLKVDWQADSQRWVSLDEVLPQEENRFQNTDNVAYGYRVAGAFIILYPSPPSGTYRHRYVPAPAKLSVDGDTVDGVAGWEEFIVWDCAAKCAVKNEMDPGPFISEREQVRQRIAAEAEDRQSLSNRRIIDVRDRSAIDAADWFWYRPA